MLKNVKEMEPTLERMATLMVSSIYEDKKVLKDRIKESLDRLIAETFAQQNGDRYEFLTNEEQDVNRRIKNSDYSQSEILNKIREIIYDGVVEISNRYNHDKRIADCENADPERRHLNETLVKVPGMPGESKTYVQGVEERIQALPYYQDHKIRKNAVISYDVVLTFSKGADEALRMDIEEWKRRNVEFLRNTFTVAPDGRTNIISMQYHGDESTPHIHAVVVPIDERGRLNARRFTGGSRMMSDLQTSYAKEMSVFGLERGLEGSSARHV
jgi:hypothetical protein